MICGESRYQQLGRKFLHPRTSLRPTGVEAYDKSRLCYVDLDGLEAQGVMSY